VATPLEAEAAAPPRRRTWPRRLLIAANIFVAVCVVLTAATYGYVRWKFGQIDTIAGLGKIFQPAEAGGGGSDEPMTVLLVGSDTRGDITGEDAKHYGSTKDVQGQRSETIILLRVDPKQKTASMLSIPRDLYVPISGTKRSDRINSAFEDGAGRLISTIQDDFKIPIQHYVEVDFNSFRGVVAAVGGVEIYSPARARDTVTGLNIPNAGCVSLDGTQALAYVRSRHYEYFENGRWRSDPTGDLGRIQRQQDFIRRVLKKANQKARGLNVLAINRLVETGVKNVKMDDQFSAGEISALARRFKSLDPNAVQTLTLPTVPANIGGAAVLRLKQPDAQQVVDTFLQKAPAAAPTPGAAPNIPPASIRVRVINGSGAEGQARDVAQQLQDAGFSVAGLGQAPSFKNPQTVISYATGQRDKALVVQSRVQGDSVLKEDPTLRIDVVLMTGGSFGGIVGASTTTSAQAGAAASTTAPAAKAPATTSTTAPPAGPQC
jgi:LCP family protein required for cell wall assembly